MRNRVIYFKKYPHDTTINLEKHKSAASYAAADENQKSFDVYYQTICKQVKHIPILSREKESVRFINLAIKIAELYQLDTVIIRHDSHISVDYSFDCGGGMKHLKSIFTLADDYCFFCGAFNREITISMNYYTHYVLKNNKIIAP